MSTHILKSTHDGILKIGEVELECHVLEDTRRVFALKDLMAAFNLQNSQKDQPRVLNAFLNKIKFISIGNEELRSPLCKPIKFIIPGKGGSPLNGYAAELIPEICNSILILSSRYMLPIDLREAAERSSILLNSFAKIGILALVDEATGYQDQRDKNALRAILDKYLSAEYSAWAKRFPDEFYREMFRLKNWEWLGMKINRPGVVGHYTNEIVYSRLAPGVLSELKRINPPDETGKRKAKHHQWLTPDIGHPALNQHIFAVLAIMRLSSSWGIFTRNLTKAFPKIGEQMGLDFEESES
ncbi:MAG: hypothetical protein A2001_01635 [Treponema sp. GWC1_61_84]|nr:MAG: hypothetical protein A2001_01635 [Treponema sp. GWC1_61_84]